MRDWVASKILLINVHSSRNAGDAALALAAIEQLKEYFPESYFILAMDDPLSHSGEGQAMHSFFGWVKKDGKWRLGSLLWLIPASILPILTYRLFGKAVFALTPASWRALLRAYTQADIVVSKPGGFLYSSGRGMSFIIAVYTLALALLAGKPVYMLPQSIGPLSHHWECVLLKWVLNRVRIVMVREPVSLRQLQACGLSPSRCYLLPDMAFAFSGAPPSFAEKWLQAQGIKDDRGEPLLGMTVLNWGAQNPRFQLQAEYEAACATAARFFVEHYGGKVFLFPQVWGPLDSQDDRVPARRIADQLADLTGSIFMIEDPLPPDLLKSVYGLMDLFIGTRMHSNIFALSQGVPTIAIGYQHKTWGIIQMMGLERWHIDIQQVNAQILTEKLAALWTERDVVRSYLNQIIPTLSQQAGQAGAMIADDFATLHRVSKNA